MLNLLPPPEPWLDVDDILATFDKKQDPLDFLRFSNKKHPKIKFMKEK